MKTYAKGARFERDVLHFLNSRGFACMRQASSGGFLTPVDIIAMKRGLVLAIECKNHAKKPKLEKNKVQSFKEWCEKAGAIGLLAWKNKTKWLFLTMKNIEENRYEDENWIEMHHLLEALDFR